MLLNQLSPKVFLLVLAVFLLLSQRTKAADFEKSVVINEIVWMGSGASSNDEWIELYNNTPNPINLEGWVLKSEDKTPIISLKGFIPAYGFYLLERTDDNSAPAKKADLIYKGALGNNGENLQLFDSSGKTIDMIDAQSGWFGGDNKTKQTMERKSPDEPGNEPRNWQASQNPGGTPGNKNSAPQKEIVKPLKESEKEPKIEPEANKTLAAVSRPFLQTKDSRFAFLMALGISILSGIIFIFLKNRHVRP